MVPSSKTTHRFPNRRQLQEGASFAMKRTPHVELRVAPQRTPHRLRYGVIDNDRQIPQHRQWGRLLNFVALTRQIEEGIDQYYPTNGYAFGVKKPRRTQITQRPNSSSARGIVPACPARCLRWSPNV